MASTTETSTLEGGDVAQDTALAEETLEWLQVVFRDWLCSAKTGHRTPP